MEIQTWWVTFEVSNAVGESAGKGVEEVGRTGAKEIERSGVVDPGPGGIGLKNVRRRLDILYGSNYALNIERKDNIFKVHLKIPVS